MGLGNLDREISIETVAETVTTNGERTLVWSVFHSCWAGIDLGKGGEGYEADQLTASDTINFRIRYFADITTKMKIVYDELDYDILHISEEGRRRFLILNARKKS